MYPLNWTTDSLGSNCVYHIAVSFMVRLLFKVSPFAQRLYRQGVVCFIGCRYLP